MRRFKEHHEEVDAEGSWAVSYGDMVTLLLTFFIVFFTLDPEGAKNQILKISMVNALESTSKNEIYQGVESEISIGKDQKQGIDPIVVKTWNGVVHDRGNYVLVEFPGVSFFKSAKTDVTKEGQASIQNFVKSYLPFAGSYRVGIRAFADRRQVMKNARFNDNLELTALRSVATMRVLQKAGIPLNRIKVGGYGETLVTARELESIPVAQRSPASELDLARKVVLVIEPEIEWETRP